MQFHYRPTGCLYVTPVGRLRGANDEHVLLPLVGVGSYFALE